LYGAAGAAGSLLPQVLLGVGSSGLSLDGPFFQPEWPHRLFLRASLPGLDCPEGQGGASNGSSKLNVSNLTHGKQWQILNLRPLEKLSAPNFMMKRG